MSLAYASKVFQAANYNAEAASNAVDQLFRNTDYIACDSLFRRNSGAHVFKSSKLPEGVPAVRNNGRLRADPSEGHLHSAAEL